MSAYWYGGIIHYCVNNHMHTVSQFLDWGQFNPAAIAEHQRTVASLTKRGMLHTLPPGYAP
ncbi:hypothetical protein GCM10023116_37390 [Kistimonas scapharcae]|uniref:Uncharacterized protein n=1 Tax=Kistimonas scapharcae TaxID=1036133 RepID=A0ABP8V8W7_9GAMM